MDQRPTFRSNGDFAIHVPDLAKARDFYAGTLGLELVSEDEDKLVFRTGAFTLYVNRDLRTRSFVPAFEVASYDAAKESLVAEGCPVIQEWPEYKALYFEDPFGNVIDIIERAE